MPPPTPPPLATTHPIAANEASGPSPEDAVSSASEPAEPHRVSRNPEHVSGGQVDERPPQAHSRPQSAEISTHSIVRTLGRFVLFHIPAVTFTVLLLVVYIQQLSWNPTPNHIAGLLVGAKVHEALIIASIFDIVYYHGLTCPAQ